MGRRARRMGAPDRFALNIQRLSSSEFTCHSIGQFDAQIAATPPGRCDSTETVPAPDPHREVRCRYRRLAAPFAPCVSQARQSGRAARPGAQGRTQSKQPREISSSERAISTRTGHPCPDKRTASCCTKSMGAKARDPGLAGSSRLTHRFTCQICSPCGSREMLISVSRYN